MSGLTNENNNSKNNMETDQYAEIIVIPENLTSAQLFAMNKQQQEQIKQQAEKNDILQANFNSVFQKFNIMSAEYISIKDQLTKVINANEQLMAENLHLSSNIQALNNELLAYSNPTTANSAESDQPVKRKCPEPANNNNSYINSNNCINIDNPIYANNPNTNHNSNSTTSNSATASPSINTDSFPSTSSASFPQQRNNNNNKQPKQKVMQTLGSNINDIKRIIKTTNSKNFVLKQAAVNAPVKITIADQTEVQAIKKALINNSISFHEYKQADEKSEAFVIRGFTALSTQELLDIRTQLIAQGLPDSIAISLLQTGYMRANPHKHHNSLVKLITPPGFDKAILKTIKYIDHVSVQFELLKSKNIMQCSNCQRFGHSASGCQHQHRCVKCGANHFKDQCPRSSNMAVKLRCCNCEGEHTANNLNECSYYINIIKKKQQQQHNNNLEQQQQYNYLEHQQQHNKQKQQQQHNKLLKQQQQHNQLNNTTSATFTSSYATANKKFSYATMAKQWPTNPTNSNNFTSQQQPAGNSNFMQTLHEFNQKLDLMMQLVTQHDSILKTLANG